MNFLLPSFIGRLNRQRYFFYFLASILLFFGLGIICSLLLRNSALLILLVISYPVSLMYSLVTRRLHDLNHNGWWAVLFFLSTVYIKTPTFIISIHALFNSLTLSHIINALNILTFLYLLLFKGTSGPNKYGPDPLGYEEYSDYLEALKTPTADN